jgi:hypothetical protein
MATQLKVRLILHRSYGDIEVEDESFDKIVESMKGFPEWLEVIDSLVVSQSASVGEKEVLEGIVESTADGPVIVVPRDRLTDKEAVGVLLYAMDPAGLKPKEMSRLLSLSGFLSVGFASRISELKREGLAYKEADTYRLTVAGKKWIEDLATSGRYGGQKA